MSAVKLLLIITVFIVINSTITKAQNGNIHIPLGGNCFLTSANQTEDQISDEGLEASIPAGSSSIALITDSTSYPLTITGSSLHTVFADGSIMLKPGYTKISLKGLQKTGEQFALVKNLVIKTDTANNTFQFVKENSGSRFYWGRRGPSVHLSFETPKDKNIAWFYSELTVPAGSDAIGSYFMANGFGEGYFGMQVNSPSERRILFSIWSPFNTDDPSAIRLIRKSFC